MEDYNEESEKVKNAKNGTFSTKIISISKTNGSKYVPQENNPEWKKEMQEIVTTDGVYITYNETQWTINEFKSKSIIVTTSPSNRINWKWIHLTKGCDCWEYDIRSTMSKKSCF